MTRNGHFSEGLVNGQKSPRASTSKLCSFSANFLGHSPPKMNTYIENGQPFAFFMGDYEISFAELKYNIHINVVIIAENTYYPNLDSSDPQSIYLLLFDYYSHHYDTLSLNTPPSTTCALITSLHRPHSPWHLPHALQELIIFDIMHAVSIYTYSTFVSGVLSWNYTSDSNKKNPVLRGDYVLW